jgi:twitching motility protein PilT
VSRITTSTEVDASFQHGPLRYRANFSKQRGGQSFSFRVVPRRRMRMEDLQLPESLGGPGQEPRGLILVTGPTGQGKSTTLRALIQHLNETQALRIITIEDPIEYLFTDSQSHFEQREVGLDTRTFADGIRNAMRQDPNVIFVRGNPGPGKHLGRDAGGGDRASDSRPRCTLIRWRRRSGGSVSFIRRRSSPTSVRCWRAI